MKMQAAAVVAMTLIAAPLALAQDGSTAQPAVSMDTASLGSGPYSRMHLLLEKTIFKVDVLTVEVWLGADDVRRIEQFAGDRPDRSELADSIAEIAIHSQDALVQVEFVRDIMLEQFLEGVQENLSLVPRYPRDYRAGSVSWRSAASTTAIGSSTASTATPCGPSSLR
jgi:hypothetical protein